MINPEELMIGNIVYRQKYIVERYQKGMDRYDLITVDPNDIHACAINSKKFIPVDITPEWNDKLDFQKGETLEDFILLVKSDWNAKLEHVHNIQNAYYILTGRQLKLKQ